MHGTGRKQKQARAFDFARYKKRHVLLKVAYLGWDYDGYVVQDSTEKTVECALFDALNKTKLIESRETSNYHRCGRTDKGVSAFGQVVSIDLRSNQIDGQGVFTPDGYDTSRLDLQASPAAEINYPAMLNSVLPPNIRVLAWAPADVGFSARFDCKRRVYNYFFPKGDLDLELMRQGCQHFIGTHDFRNFCKADVAGGVTNFVRNIESAEIVLCGNDAGGYQMCNLIIVGQAFLWHQIRCIVSVLFFVGEGQEHHSVIQELLDINKCSGRPQYCMAADFPLNLYDTSFDDVRWITDAGNTAKVIQQMQKVWTEHATKATMLRKMLNDLETTMELPGDASHSGMSLTSGSKSKQHKKLLERARGDSIDDKVEKLQRKRHKLHLS